MFFCVRLLFGCCCCYCCVFPIFFRSRCVFFFCFVWLADVWWLSPIADAVCIRYFCCSLECVYACCRRMWVWRVRVRWECTPFMCCLVLYLFIILRSKIIIQYLCKCMKQCAGIKCISSIKCFHSPTIPTHTHLSAFPSTSNRGSRDCSWRATICCVFHRNWICHQRSMWTTGVSGWFFFIVLTLVCIAHCLDLAECQSLIASRLLDLIAQFLPSWSNDGQKFIRMMACYPYSKCVF